MGAEREVSDRLGSVFNAHGWKLRPGAPDLLVHHPQSGLTYAIEIKTAHDARRGALEGLLAAAILQSRTLAREAGARPLAVVAAPRMSDAMFAALAAFARRHGDGVAWGVVDGEGLVRLEGEGLDAITHDRDPEARRPAIPGRHQPFSDLGQWMLKVLLSHQLDESLQVHSAGGHAIGRAIRNGSALAAAASVSIPVANRLLSYLREERFWDGRHPVRLVRTGELLERWRSAANRRPLELRARWILKGREDQLGNVLRKQKQSAGQRLCLGLFAACSRLGFKLVSGVSPHLYLEDASAGGLDRLGLIEAQPNEPTDVFVRQPRFPEAVFRAALPRDGLPVSDVVQCWIDVSAHPSRGEEMATHLYQRVLAPSLLAQP